MKLSKAESDMLAILSTEHPQTTGHLGATLWAAKSKVSRTPSAYARPAGRVLRSLQRKGLVVHVTRYDVYGWVRR